MITSIHKATQRLGKETYNAISSLSHTNAKAVKMQPQHVVGYRHAKPGTSSELDTNRANTLKNQTASTKRERWR
jgi:hypothetical protein